jgi:hypothetical protein
LLGKLPISFTLDAPVVAPPPPTNVDPDEHTAVALIIFPARVGPFTFAVTTRVPVGPPVTHTTNPDAVLVLTGSAENPGLAVQNDGSEPPSPAAVPLVFDGKTPWSTRPSLDPVLNPPPTMVAPAPQPTVTGFTDTLSPSSTLPAPTSTTGNFDGANNVTDSFNPPQLPETSALYVSPP